MNKKNYHNRTNISKKGYVLPHAAMWVRRHSRIAAVLFLSLMVLGVAYWWASGQAAVSTAPVNPNASSKSRQILQFLHNSRGSKTVSGQHLGNSGNAGSNLSQISTLQQQTGEWVGLMGADYDAGTYNYSTLNQILTDHSNRGGLVSVSFHAYNPANGQDYRNLNIDINKLITPGTTEYNNWRNRLDTYAAGFQQLKNNNVVVLIRPFHEHSLSSFWWTYRNSTMTAARYKTMWRQMYDYLVKTKGLDNLLWVYSPHIGDNTGLGLAGYYPGDDYVDVIGVSNYKGSTMGAADRSRVNDFVSAVPNKPFAFTEFGKNASDATYDATKLISEIKSNFPFATYAMFWNGSLGLHSSAYSNRNTYMSDSRMLHRGDINLTTDPTPPPPPVEAIGAGVYNDDIFQYSGAWNTSNNPDKYQGDDHYINIAGATATLRFDGTQVRLYGSRAPHHGIVAVSIDGGPETMIDTYAPSREEQVGYYTSPILSSGEHTVRIRVTGDKNSQATGTTIAIDKIEVTDAIAKSGDVNDDGAVNGLDLSRVLTNYGATNATRAMGDSDSNGVVNGLDLSAVLTNYGA